MVNMSEETIQSGKEVWYEEFTFLHANMQLEKNTCNNML